MTAIDWENLRYVLAVGTEGGLAGAARSLGVNHTTVLRRLAAFENQLGVRLFERMPTGYMPTAAGEELIEAARGIEATVLGVERKLAGRDLQLSGPLRITTTDTLMASVLPQTLAEFCAAYPGIAIEIAVSNAMFNLTKRDADVAIRPAPDPAETLVGRRATSIAFGVYASASYQARTPASPAGWRNHPWLAPEDSLKDSIVAQWLRAELPDVAIAARADTLVALRDLATAGLGLAALPCYLGELSPGLVRVGKPVKAMHSALWVLTHEDLRRTARVHAFIEFMAKAFTRLRPIFEGR